MFYIAVFIDFGRVQFLYANFSISIVRGRMEKVGLNISPKEFKQLSKWSENIYNTAVIIDYFVTNQPDIEECYNLAPVVKHLRNDADVLNAFFIDHEKDVEV